MKNFPCDDTLRERINQNITKFDHHTNAQSELKQAAVAITVVNIQYNPFLYGIPYQAEWKDHAALVLTQRAARLRKHAGQWALPGGRMEPGETPEETALRELEEEVGLSLTPDQIIGRLDDYTTRSGYSIKPVVVWGGPEVTLTPNPDEVAGVYRIPLREFLRDDSPIFRSIPESDNPVLIMPIGDSWIAAPTAAMIYQFCQVAILGHPTRVAHYEQPRFAWK